MINKNTVKKRIIIICVILICTLAAGTTVAVLIDNSGVLTNTFHPNDITTEVTEELNGSVKSNVRIKNTGTADAFVRAYINVTWQDENGTVYGASPVLGVDYSMALDTTGAWQLAGDGFYYHTAALAPGQSTQKLIDSCSPNEGRAPEGYKLTVEVLGSGIQTKPANVVETKWQSGVSSASSDTLTIKRAEAAE